MKKILIASNNSHKISEIKSILEHSAYDRIYSLSDFGISIEVVEDGMTLEENALKKAKAIFNLIEIPVIADDTGLFVEALGGDPGVYSARYAGENCSYEDNCKKLLGNLVDIPESGRNAQFESVICFYENQNNHKFFKGICRGKIIFEPRGKNGFGYDPLFVPEGFEKTFSELPDTEKNKISHRARSVKNFYEYINQN